jgi:hypothetical protein
MSKKNFSKKQKQIFMLERLLAETKRIKNALERFNPDDVCPGDRYPTLDGLRKDYLKWLKKASNLTGKKYESLIPSHNIPAGTSIGILQEKAIIMGDIVSVEDDIYGRIINIKKQFQKASVLIKELIVKELTSNRKLKTMFTNLLYDKIGAMARYMDEYLKSRERDLAKAVKYTLCGQNGPAHLKYLYENHIKNMLKKILKKSLNTKDYEDEFSIAYLEAKDDLIEREKTVSSESKTKRRRAEQPKEERPEYEIWLPNRDLEGCARYESLGREELKVKFEKLKRKHKLLIDNRYNAVYINGKKMNKIKIPRKDKKSKKIKYESVTLKFAKYKLLLWFLKNKDRLFDADRLYRVGWFHKWENILPENYQGTLKNEISALNAVFKATGLGKHLKIESERLLGYRCVGDCTYCLIIESGHTSLAQVPESHTYSK